MDKEQQQMDELLRRIKAKMPELECWLEQADDEDPMYRFYHQSLKLWWDFPSHTQSALRLIREIAGEDYRLNPWFCQIIDEGIREKFEHSFNQNWLPHARPVVEAFYHTRYFIAMMVKYGKELDTAPHSLPSGWASVLYLFQMR